jgi:hypothetical protein
MDGIENVDAVVASIVLAEEERQPFAGAEALAVRAILELSRTGAHNSDTAALIKARELIQELADLRRGRGDKLTAFRF